MYLLFFKLYFHFLHQLVCITMYFAQAQEIVLNAFLQKLRTISSTLFKLGFFINFLAFVLGCYQAQSLLLSVFFSSNHYFCWKKKKERLFGNTSDSRDESTTRNSAKEIHAILRSAKATVIICILFVIAELPHGLLALLSGVMGQQFFHNYYTALSDFLDILVLVNYSVNFIICCAMSQTYRTSLVVSFRLTTRNSSSV